MKTRPAIVTAKRLLVINPNTNPDVTEQIRRAARAFVAPGTLLDAVNPRRGPFAIETPADCAVATSEVLALIRATSAYDGYVLACFDDIAIAKARRLVSEPVISMAEAGVRNAAADHERFAVITTVEAAVPTIQRLADSYGMAGRHIVLATGIGVTETAERTVRAEKALSNAVFRCRDEFGAEAILLGSGAYAGRSEELGRLFDIPFIDGLQAAVSYCQNAESAQI